MTAAFEPYPKHLECLIEDGGGFNVVSPGEPDPRLFLFADPDDAEAARALGMKAAAFTASEGELARADVCVVAPANHLYASEQAYSVASYAGRSGARSIRVVDPPGIKANETFREWFKVWTADDLSALADEPSSSREWHPSAPGPVGEMPEIEITTREHEVNDAVLGMLARDPNLYRFGGALATILDEGEAPRGVAYQGESPPQVRTIGLATLRERITSRVRFAKWRRKGDLEEKVPAHPPEWCVSAIHQRGEYPGLRPLAGVIQAPTIRRDGSILDRPGYDADTRLFYRPNDRFEPIPQAPTREDAEAARDLLLDLVADFPFRGAADRALWLAALLTVLARTLFDGPAPLFGFDANCPGSGKTMLVELIAVIATRRAVPRTTYPGGRGGDDEMRKRITSIALAGDRLTLIDNIDEPLGGASLDAALTATVWKDRVLGSNQMTPELPLNVTWFASGNNLQCKGDLLRRVLFTRIESQVENPEEREGFRHPDLIGHARENRGRLVVAALTILRAHHVAGRPSPVKPLGSFEGWTRAVADPVAWIMGVDPLDVRKLIKAADQGANLRNALVEGWAELPRAEAGLTVAEAFKLLKAPGQEDRFSTLRAGLMELSPNGDLPSPKSIGKHLTLLQGRVVGSIVLRSKPNRKGVMEWRVEPAPDPAGFAGFEKPLPGLDSAKPGTVNPSHANDLRPHAGFAGFESPPSREKNASPENSPPEPPATNPAKHANPAGGMTPLELAGRAVFVEGDRPF